MAAGDLVVADYQYEFVSLLMGANTIYTVESLEGLYGLPDLRSNDLERQDRHGVVPGVDLMGARTITAALKISTGGLGTIETAVQALAPLVRPKQTELPFVWQRPRTAGSIKKYINCRVRNFKLNTNYAMAHGYAEATLQLLASDPRHYTLGATTTSGAIPTSSAAGSATFAVGGDFYTEPVISIVGPFNNGIITLSTAPNVDDTVMQGRAIRLTGNVSAAQTLVIDFAARTMTLNGSAIYSYRRTDSQWWSLTPGSNTVTFNRDAGAVGSSAPFTIVHRAAWVH